MTPLSAFRPRIALRVPGAADPLIDMAVLDACVDFCEQSLAVRRMHDTITTVAGRQEYELSGFNEQVVSRVMRVWVDDAEIAPIGDDVAPVSDGNSMPRAFSSPEPGVLALHPTPDKAYTVNLRAALRPGRTATQVHDELFERHVETIVNGALGRLYAMPAESFFNPQLAGVHAGGFRVGVNAAMLDATRGRTTAPLRVTPVHI